jgi:hypothetical protein
MKSNAEEGIVSVECVEAHTRQTENAKAEQLTE